MLSAPAARVLGCLIEKAMTTPDYYPMTINALRAAANQSTNRDPVVSYDEATIASSLSELQEGGLARAVHAPGQRTVKYRHAADEILDLDAGATAVLAVLLLRGEQTPGELRGRTERYRRFESPAEVEHLLESLAAREESLVRVVARKPGEKESRWVQLLAEGGDGGAAEDPPEMPDLAKVDVLERRLDDLTRRVEALEQGT